MLQFLFKLELFFTTMDSSRALTIAVQARTQGSSGGLTREVQVVAKGSLGVLTKNFRKLDHGTQLKAV
jgi:hypothetical protein